MQKLYFYKCTHFLVFLLFSKVIIHQLHSYTKIPTLIPRISNVIALVPTLIPRIPTLIPRIPTLIPRIPTLIPCIPTLIPRIPTLIPHIPIIPLIAFPNSLFWLLQITYKLSELASKLNVLYSWLYYSIYT